MHAMFVAHIVLTPMFRYGHSVRSRAHVRIVNASYGRPALFRPEAIAFQRQHRQSGDVACLQPVSTKIIAWLLVLSSAAVVCFLIIAQYARKETAIGYLTPTRGTAKVFAPQRGAIKQLYVEEGDTVAEGQPLLAVETDQIASDGSDVNASMLDTLRSQKELCKRTFSLRSSAVAQKRIA